MTAALTPTDHAEAAIRAALHPLTDRAERDLLARLLCENMDPNHADAIRAAVACHRHQTTEDFEAWALAAERLTTCGVAAEAACLSAEVDYPLTRMDREARHD